MSRNVFLRAARVAGPSILVSLMVLAYVPGFAARPRQARSPAAPVVDTARLVQDLRWRNVGPHRGGRVTAVAGVRTQPCTFYFGATGGGMWKTNDCGHRWDPVADGQIATGSIGAIEVSDSHPEVVYVGTGSAAIRSNVIIGRGMYRSADAGKTWAFAGLREAGQIGSLAVHPTTPDTVWAAALGSPYGPTPQRGVFKTTDGGRTWRKVLFVNEETGARVVAVNPANPDELYAGMYRGFRKGWDIVSGGPASEGGIYKSTDGGETWTKLSTGLPRSLIGKIDLDIARSNPRAVYAMIEAPGAEGGLYKTTDAGATWSLVTNDQRLRARPFYFNYVDVNPRNEHEVWVSELRLWTLARRREDVGGGGDAARRQPRDVVQPGRPEPGHPEQRWRGQRDARRRAHVVERLQPADGRVLHGGGGRAVPVSTVRAAAGQHHGGRAQPAPGLVVPRFARDAVGTRAGMRDGPGVSTSRRVRRVGRVQGRSGSLRRRERPGTALLGVPAEPVRARPGRHPLQVPAANGRPGFPARPEGDLPGLARAAPHDGRRQDVGR